MAGISREEFGFAYSQWHYQTVRLLASRGIGLDLARDVTQQAWGRGWERLGQLRDSRQLVPWINTIAWNLCKNRLRRAASEPLVEAALVAPESSPGDAAFNQLLDHCRPKEAWALRLFYSEGYDCREIALRAGSTPVAIRVLLHRARRRLRRVLHQGRSVRRTVESQREHLCGALD